MHDGVCVREWEYISTNLNCPTLSLVFFLLSMSYGLYGLNKPVFDNRKTTVHLFTLRS